LTDSFSSPMPAGQAFRGPSIPYLAHLFRLARLSSRSLRFCVSVPRPPCPSPYALMAPVTLTTVNPCAEASLRSQRALHRNLDVSGGCNPTPSHGASYFCSIRCDALAWLSEVCPPSTVRTALSFRFITRPREAESQASELPCSLMLPRCIAALR